MSNIAERFVDAATRFPDRTFLVAAYDPLLEEMSYGEALRRARVFAEHLGMAGVAVGDRIVLHCPNSLDYVCAYFGILLAGGTVIPLDPRSRPSHVSHVFADCGARCIVLPVVKPELDPNVRQIALADCDWTASPRSGRVEAPRNPLALIIYTSGTTGVPRGVCLSHDNLEHTRASFVSWARVKDRDRELTTLPLTHLFALSHLHVHSSLGATMYLEEGFRDIPRLLDNIARFDITCFPATPGSLKIIVERFSDAFALKARRLRYMIINTSPMPVALTQRLLALVPTTDIFMYYGLTEASRSAYVAYRDHPDKLETVGRATPGAAICIGHPRRPAIGEPGEILVKGPQVTAGYWGQDSSEFFEEGWFRTGDLGVMDGDGFVTWLGRVREQINVNGLKLVPTEVEDVLRRDPRVLDCAVVGVPDAASGESVAAFVIAEEGAADARFERHLRKLCNEHLEDHKVPRRVLFVGEIPKTDTGKVKRHVLRDSLLPGR